VKLAQLRQIERRPSWEARNQRIRLSWWWRNCHTAISAAMAPAATMVHSNFSETGQTPSTVKRGWTEARSEIPSILVGRGQENASTIRHNLEQNMDSQRKSSERARSRGRQNSLKRAKNSTDMLRQRSMKRDGKDADANPNTREGRQFTVANVGNNGKIYLR